MHLLPLVQLLALASPTWAAPAVDPFEEQDEEDAFRFEEQMVTVASRYAQTVRQAPGIVTVITDRQIRDRGFITLADVLRSLPGIYISVAPESRSLAWFRGVVSADNNKILLLVDGVPWYDGVYTHAWVDEYIPLDNVKQVEIIKGPGSAIYGTNAFAGVINVVTYKAEDLGGGFARGVAGSYARHGGSLVMADQFNGVDRPFSLSTMVRYLDMDGDGLDYTPKGYPNVTGTDPRRSVNAALRLTWDKLDLSLSMVDYRHTYFTQPQSSVPDVYAQSVDEFNLRYLNEFFSGRYRARVGANTELTPYLFAQHHDNPGSYGWISDPEITVDKKKGEISASQQTTVIQTEKETMRVGAGMELKTRPVAAHTVVGGAGMELNRVIKLVDITYTDLSTTPDENGFRIDPEANADLWDAFVYMQDTWSALYWLELTGGIRADYHSVSGLFPSPRAGILMVPGPDTTLKLLYGRAFRSPTARELLVIVEKDDEGYNMWTAGNKYLQPERIDTVEAEYLGDLTRWLSLRGAAYYSGIHNEIDKHEPEQPHPTLGDSFYDNAQGSDILGAELETTFKVRSTELDLSWSYTHAKDRETGRAQYEFPPHMAHARLSGRPIEPVRTSLLVDIYGKRPRAEWSPDAKLEDGPAFVLLGGALATNLTANGHLRADLSVHNLVNAKYETLTYRDSANVTKTDDTGAIIAKYPEDIQGPERSFVVGIEGEF